MAKHRLTVGEPAVRWNDTSEVNIGSFVQGTGGTHPLSQYATVRGVTPVYTIVSGGTTGISVNASTGLLTVDSTVPADTYSVGITLSDGVTSAGSRTFTFSVASSSALVHGTAYSVNGSGFGTRPNYNTENRTWNGHSHLHFIYTDFPNALPADGVSAATLREALQGWDIANGSNTTGTTPNADGASLPLGGPSRSGRYYSNLSIARHAGLRRVTPSNVGRSDTLEFIFSCKFRAITTTGGKQIRVWQTDNNNNLYVQQSGGLSFEYGFLDTANVSLNGAASNSLGNFSTWKRRTFLVQDMKFRAYVNDVNSTVSGSGAGAAAGQSYWPVTLVSGTAHANNTRYSFPDSITDTAAAQTYTGQGRVDYADTVLDFSVARVEIVQGTGASAIVEYQPLLSWSDTAISYAFQKGELTAGAAQLRVINSSNAQVYTASVTVA